MRKMAKLALRPIFGGMIQLGNEAPGIITDTSPDDIPKFVLPNVIATVEGKGELGILMMQTAGIDETQSFVSLNANPDDVLGRDTSDAQGKLGFVGRLLPHSGNEKEWVQQTFIIGGAHPLFPDGNVLRIHSRSVSGKASGNIEDFSVQKIFVLYPVPD
jgi:hypothetical protein